MAYFLRKMVEHLLLPIGICGLLTIAGLILRRRWMIVTGLIVLLAFSTDLASWLLTHSLENVYEPKTVSQCPTADAIVVLSGNIVRGITPPGVQYGDGANRFFAGLSLALAGKAKTIVFTGAPLNGGAETEGGILRQVAIQQGIAPERIVVTGQVLTTADEASAVSSIPGVRSIVLVTSAMHMPRAAMLLRATGLRVTPFPTDEHYLAGAPQFLFSLLPTADGLWQSDAALREYYGLAVYRILLLFRHPRAVGYGATGSMWAGKAYSASARVASSIATN